MADEGRCAHDMCDCAAEGDTKYCSDHCRDAADQDMVEISAGTRADLRAVEDQPRSVVR